MIYFFVRYIFLKLHLYISFYAIRYYNMVYHFTIGVEMKSLIYWNNNRVIYYLMKGIFSTIFSQTFPHTFDCFHSRNIVFFRLKLYFYESYILLKSFPLCNISSSPWQISYIYSIFTNQVFLLSSFTCEPTWKLNSMFCRYHSYL